MKKICFVIGGMTRGGAERVISILANHYSEIGYRVNIVTLLTKRCEYKLNPKIELIDCSFEKENYLKCLPFWIKKFRCIIKSQDPDVIVSFVARINAIVLFSMVGLKKRVIVSERNDPLMDGRSCFEDIIIKLLYRRAHSIIFQTERVKSYFGKRVQSKSVIIGNPIQVNMIANNCSTKKIVSVGRLAEQKNHKMLINAFSKIYKRFPDYKLFIYGDGNLKNELTQQIRILDLESAVFLLGNIIDIHEQIADAEIFVLPSNFEGQSNALLEAMMMGLMVISTNCAGSDEVIKHLYNGMLIPVGNEEKLVEALVYCILNKVDTQRMSLNARSTSIKYSWKNVMKAWDDIILNKVEVK